MERVKERLAIGEAALATLDEALTHDLSARATRDVAILRFAYSFEAILKCAQRYLAVKEGTEIAGPKSIVRASFQNGLLDEPQAERALGMVNDRNLVVHTYNERLAVELASRIHGHAAVLHAWLAALGARV